MRTGQTNSGFGSPPAGTPPLVIEYLCDLDASPRRSALRPRAQRRSGRRAYLREEEFAGLLPRIADALPKTKRLYAPALTRLVLVTRGALIVTKNAATIGHPTFQDPEAQLRAAQDELKRCTAQLRWYRSRPGPQHDEVFNKTIMATVAAKVRRDGNIVKYPDRSKLEEKVRQWLKRSRP
jgi:hypothetical protein